MDAPRTESMTEVGADDLLLEAARKLGLEANLADLELNGYTVVPPEKVASTAFLGRLEAAVRASHAARSATGRETLERAHAYGAGELVQNVIWDDPVYEVALMNPVVQTLARWMCGHTCRISLFGAALKPPGGGNLDLHCDTELTEPYPPVPQFCNVTYALSDYSAEDGATIFVPGSHRLARQPRGTEIDGDFSRGSVAGGLRLPEPVAVECAAGSLIAWTGLTWHGARPRRRDGHRVSLLLYFCRWYLHQQENFRDHIPPGALERNPARFAQLLDVVPGWAVKDPRADPATAPLGRQVHPILDVARP